MTASSPTPAVHVYADKAELVAGTAAQMVTMIGDAIAQRGRCSLALSGGSTPKPLYATLAQADLPWDKLYIYWGDERYVPIDHQDSNAKMAKEAWLDQVPIPAENVFIVPTATDSPAASAEAYQAMLASSFDSQTAAPPVFDIMLLGMGDDGHTASLFPNTPALEETTRWVTVGSKDGQPRITFSVPLINRARQIIFLIAGANKQSALAQVFAPSADSSLYPSRLIAPTDGAIYWFMDKAASQGLPDTAAYIEH